MPNNIPKIIKTFSTRNSTKFYKFDYFKTTLR